MKLKFNRASKAADDARVRKIDRHRASDEKIGISDVIRLQWMYLMSQLMTVLTKRFRYRSCTRIARKYTRHLRAIVPSRVHGVH